MPSDFAQFLAKAQMDPGWQSGLGTGPLMVGGQIFPGTPAAQEFDWMEAGPPGTGLVAGAGMPLAMTMANIKLWPRVAIKGPDKIYIGEPGEPHFKLYERLPEEIQKSLKSKDSGWIDESGIFFNRYSDMNQFLDSQMLKKNPELFEKFKK